MNQQISRLLASVVLLATIAFVGCDLGTYSKRFKERNQPLANTDVEGDDEADEADEDSGDSE